LLSFSLLFVLPFRDQSLNRLRRFYVYICCPHLWDSVYCLWQLVIVLALSTPICKSLDSHFSHALLARPHLKSSLGTPHGTQFFHLHFQHRYPFEHLGENSCCHLQHSSDLHIFLAGFTWSGNTKFRQKPGGVFRIGNSDLIFQTACLGKGFRTTLASKLNILVTTLLFETSRRFCSR
jgi:hypothetical protein